MKSSNEIKLIFLCSNPSMTFEQEKKASHLLEKKLDWDGLIDRANSLGVSLLLYKQLRKKFHTKIPDQAMKRLYKILFHNTAKNMVHSKVLLQILSLFNNNKILAIPFKGPVLSENLYGNDSLRFFGDLDIFIHSDDITKAKNLLISNDYKLIQQIPKRHEKKYFHIDHALDFFHTKTKIRVDLQWKLFRIYTVSPITLTQLKQRAIKIDFCGKQIHSLSEEDLLFFLCVHSSKHHWEKLEYITSVSELVRGKNNFNWEYILTFAEKEGCKRMILLGLHLANTLYNTALPKSIVTKIHNDKRIFALSKQIINSYLYGKPICSSFTNNIDLSFFQIQVRDGIKARSFFLFRALTRPSFKEFDNIKAPFIFYYFFKPLRLLYKLILFLIFKKLSSK